MAPKLFRLPILIFVVVFAVSITLTQYLAYQQYKISREKQRAELIHEAAGVKDRFRNILFNDIAAANTLAIIYKQYGVPAKFDSIARQILQTSRYAEALQITENGIVRNAYPDALYKGAIGTNINADPVRKAEEARAVDRKDIYFAGPRRLRFGDTGILGKVPIITNNRVIAVATVLTRLPAIKKALEPGKGDKNKFVYELLKSNRNDTSLFPLSFAKPAVKSEYRDIEIPEGDWLLRVSYGQGYTADKFNYELSGLGVLFSFIIALLAYRKAQEPYKLNKIIDEKTAQLAKSEEYFRTLIENASDAIYVVDNEGHFIDANDSMCKMVGYSKDELLQLRVEDVFDSEQLKTDPINLSIVPYSTVFKERRFIRKDGVMVDVEVHGKRFDENMVMGVARDVTERKQAEEIILKEKELSETIINSLPGIFYLRDEQGRALRWNKNVEEVLGYTAEELDGALLRDFVAEEDLETLRQAAEKTFKEGYATAEVGALTKGGRKIPYLLTQRPVYYGGQLCVLGTGIDISERIRAEQLLSESEARFRSAFEDSAIGMGLTSVEKGSMGRWLKVNRSLCEMLGYTEGELLSLTFMQITHPEDLARDLAAQDLLLQGESDTYRLEKRYIHKNGSFIWINLNVSIIRNKDSQPIYLVAQIENITEKVESQIKFQNLVENFIVGVYILQNGKLVYINPRLIEETGYTEEEIIGMPYDRFIYEDDRAFVMDIIDSREKGLIDTVRYEARIIKKDGQTLWYEIIGSTISYKGATALIGTMINVSERKAFYAELTKSEANLRSIFDVTDISYLLLDADFNIVALNQNMRDVYQDNVGVPLKEGDNLIEVITPERRERMHELYSNVLNSKKPGGYETSFTNDGLTKHFAASVIPIIVGNKAIGICISSVDITERKHALKKLEETNENLKKHAKELAISNAELEQFAYVASHDLQEPLRMVTSFMTQLEKKYGDVVDNKGRQYIHFAVDGAKRMRQIILDLLNFSRVGSLDDDTEDVDFNKLMNEIQALYRRQIEELYAKINFENLPVLHIHKTPVRQVFQNLVGNSLKYHRTKVAPVIDISCIETKTHYQFSVKDNGIGIAREYFDKIFIIFQRLHNKDEYSGTGMGLAITKKIVESMGGKIWLESEEGKGSTFHFTLLKKQ